MTAPLPESGPEKAIFVRALREYSSSCEPPSLTPSCPYYRLSEDGPWCLEECYDLLAEQGDASPAGLEILDGYRVVPMAPRSRRRPPGASKPFDSAEIHMVDRERPVEDWRLSTLLLEMRDRSSPPLDASADVLAGRPSRMEVIFDQLRSYEVDGESLLRSVFVAGMGTAVAATTAMPLILGGDDQLTELPDELRKGLADWACLLLGEDRSPSDWFAVARERGSEWAAEQIRHIFSCTPRISAWLQSRPLDELLSWRSPNQLEFEIVRHDQHEPPPPCDRWLMDRFMRTYLTEWSYDSLLLEWRYLQGSEPAPCSREGMRERFVDASELAHEIASRAAAGETAGSETMMSVSAFVRPALAHLGEGRFTTAAAIFDACRIASPNDAEAHNNYGFCALPTDVPAALAALDRAAELGMFLSPVNAANRMVALHRLNRAGTALEVAQRVAASAAWTEPSTAYLWSWETTEPKVVNVTDVRRYIAEYALAIAQEVMDESSAKAWTLRLSELG